MELRQESSKFGTPSAITLRNLSSSSSAFLSATQSPFFSPRSPISLGSESTRFGIPDSNTFISSAGNPLISVPALQKPKTSSDLKLVPVNYSLTPNIPASSTYLISYSPAPSVPASSTYLKPTVGNSILDQVTSSNDITYNNSSSRSQGNSNGYSGHREKPKRLGRNHGRFSFSRSSVSLSSSNRLRCCDVYIGLHGRKPSLLRFANWLRAELEIQGLSCFAVDKARCRKARSHDVVEKAMNASTFGVVILTKKSFGNPYSMEELRSFLYKKNLVPIFFDLGPGDCLARDIIEKRGELWEKHGGELWRLYGGLEKEWKEAVNGLSRVDEWKLEAHEGNYRDCILRAVILLATRLGRRSIIERVSRWREKMEKEEFPFPRNENFVGRKKELSELELILFGDVSGDGEREYFELKTKQKHKNLVISQSESDKVEERVRDQKVARSHKGKEPVIWMESEKEIEMQSIGSPQRQYRPLRVNNGGRHGRRKRSMKILYGKGIACVSGESGIGKTELLLEYAYRYSQRYKMVLWVGGESRYICQNYLNLWSFLEVDVSIENQCPVKGRTKSFEEQEEEAILRVRKELMRDIPYLVIIDNLENEKDWWGPKLIMDFLPRFGGQTHFIIATRLPRVMNLEPLKLSYLSGVEAMYLMKGRFKEYPVVEVDALRLIEEKLGRLTLGLGIIGAILSELPINPSRLLDTINRMPLRAMISTGNEVPTLSKQTFLMQLLDVCFSIFDHADGPRSLATRMVQVSGWFAPAAIPISLLSLAAHKVPEKHRGSRLWNGLMNFITCSFTTSHIKRSEAEAAAMLVRFGIARSSTHHECIHFHEIIKQYSQKTGVTGVSRAMVEAISVRGSISQHSEHLWAMCFLLFRFGADPVLVELKVPELMFIVKRIVVPLAIHTFITFSRCNAAIELLRRCTDALEAAEDSFVSRVDKWMDGSFCWKRNGQSNAQLHPFLWQELALLKATVLETRAKLMIRGGHYDIGDDLIRKTIYIRSSICGEEHPDTISAKQTLSKLTRLLTNKQFSVYEEKMKIRIN